MPNRLGYCHPNTRKALTANPHPVPQYFANAQAERCRYCRRPVALKRLGNVGTCYQHAPAHWRVLHERRKAARRAARGEYPSHHAGRIAGDIALREVLDQLGGDWPRDLVQNPLFSDPPGDNPGARAQAQADLARAWIVRGEDGGAAWRATVRRLEGLA